MRPLALFLLPALLAASAALAQPVTPTPEALFAQSYGAYGERRYEDAIRDFGAFREAYPEHPGAADALFYQAHSTLALGHDDEAVRLFTLFEQRYPAHPLAYEARLAAARVFFERQDYARARDLLEALVASRPPAEPAAKALFWLGETHLALGDDDAALQAFERAADRYPNTTTAPSALYAVAYHLIRLDRLPAAARTLEKLEDRYPDSPYSRDLGLAFAEVYYELEDYNRLVDETTRRLDNLTGSARERALFLLAEGYNHLGRAGEAEQTYRLLLTDYAGGPYYRPALVGLGRNAYETADYRRAAEYYGLAAEGQTDSLAAEAAYRQAGALALAGEMDAAAERFEAVYTTWPRHRAAEQALFEHGVLEYRRERWEGASLAFERLLRAFPESAFADEALELYANARIAAGDSEGAEKLFDRAISRQRDAAPELRDNLAFQKAYLLYGSGAYEQAGRTFERLAGAGATPALKGDALFWLGETQFQQGDLGAALATLRSYLDQNPEGAFRSAARYVMGWAYFRQERYEQASLAFEAFLDQYEPDPDAPADAPAYRDDAHLRLGDSYFALRRYLEAVNAYARVRGEGRDYAFYQMGQSYFFAGQPDRGRRSLERLLREFPGSPWREEAAYSIGYFFLQEGRYDEAIAAFEQVVREFPRDPLAGKALYGVGDAYYNRGMLEDAARAYRAVLARYGNTAFAADAATSLQATLRGLGRDDEAAAIVDSFSVAAPPDVADELRFRRAEDFYVRGRYRDAEPALAEFIRTTGDAALQTDARYFLGDLYADEGRVDEAARLLRQVVTGPASPRQSEAARRLARLYLDNNRPRDAHDAFQTLERLAAGNADVVAEARLGQARALLANGQLDAAERLYDAALDATPEGPSALQARLGQARILEARGQTDAALEAYEQLSADAAEVGAEATYRLGALHLAGGNLDAALAALASVETRFAGFDEWVASSLLAMARAHTQQGNVDEARRLYDQVIRDYPDTPWARAASEARQE